MDEWTETALNGGVQILADGDWTEELNWPNPLASATSNVFSGQWISGIEIAAGGSVCVSNGGLATNINVTSGGTMQVYSGGAATVISVNRGSVVVNSGSVVSGVGISSGGQITLYDATVSDIRVSSGSTLRANHFIGSGNLLDGAVFLAGAMLSVATGAHISGTDVVMEEGAVLSINGSNGISGVELSGTMNGSAFSISGGTATNVHLWSQPNNRTGRMNLAAGEIAQNLHVHGSAYFYLGSFAYYGSGGNTPDDPEGSTDSYIYSPGGKVYDVIFDDDAFFSLSAIGGDTETELYGVQIIDGRTVSVSLQNGTASNFVLSMPNQSILNIADGGVAVNVTTTGYSVIGLYSGATIIGLTDLNATSYASPFCDGVVGTNVTFAGVLSFNHAYGVAATDMNLDFSVSMIEANSDQILLNRMDAFSVSTIVGADLTATVEDGQGGGVYLLAGSADAFIDNDLSITLRDADGNQADAPLSLSNAAQASFQGGLYALFANDGTLSLAVATDQSDQIEIVGGFGALESFGMGAGDDVLTLTLNDATTVSSALDGGDGSDALILSGTGSAVLSGTVSGFERMEASVDATMSEDGVLQIRYDGGAFVLSVAEGASFVNSGSIRISFADGFVLEEGTWTLLSATGDVSLGSVSVDALDFSGMEGLWSSSLNISSSSVVLSIGQVDASSGPHVFYDGAETLLTGTLELASDETLCLHGGSSVSASSDPARGGSLTLRAFSVSGSSRNLSIYGGSLVQESDSSNPIVVSIADDSSVLAVGGTAQLGAFLYGGHEILGGTVSIQADSYVSILDGASLGTAFGGSYVAEGATATQSGATRVSVASSGSYIGAAFGGHRIEGGALTQTGDSYAEISGGARAGSAYGGSMLTGGELNAAGTTVSISGGSVTAAYGGHRIYGGTATQTGDSVASVLSARVLNVYGGSYVTSGGVLTQTGDSIVELDAASVQNNVYGGACIQSGSATVGNVGVVASGSTIGTGFYGGSYVGLRGVLVQTGSASVVLENSVIRQSAFAGNAVLNSATATLGDSVLTMSGGTAAAVYGGNYTSNGTIETMGRTGAEIIGGTATAAYGGNLIVGSRGSAMQAGDSELTLSLSDIGTAFGGSVLDSGASAVFQGSSAVFVSGSTVATVFGGHRVEGGASATISSGDASVVVSNSFVSQVYGGSLVQESGSTASHGAGETLVEIIAGSTVGFAIGGSRVQGGASATIASDASVTISGGTVTNMVIGGNMLNNKSGAGSVLADAGDHVVTITGGVIGGIVVGGNYIQTSTALDEGQLTQSGSSTVTVSGGTFNGSIYGASSYQSSNASKGTTFQGNVSITIDSSSNAISFAAANSTGTTGSIFAGGHGYTTIEGNATVTFTGLGSNLEFTGYLSGASSYLKRSQIGTATTGTSALVFESFTGDLNADTIMMFESLTIDSNSCVSFTGENADLSTVSTWNLTQYAADATKTTLDWTPNSGQTQTNFTWNDFSGDTLNLTMSDGAESWTVIEFTTYEHQMNGFGSNMTVVLNGEAAAWDSDLSAWTSTNYSLFVDSESSSLVMRRGTIA